MYNQRSWEASWGKILTCDQSLSLCQECEETTVYLLLHCPTTRVVWDFAFLPFGVSWVLPCFVKDSILGWKGYVFAKDKRGVWNAGPLCISLDGWEDKEWHCI